MRAFLAALPVVLIVFFSTPAFACTVTNTNPCSSWSGPFGVASEANAVKKKLVRKHVKRKRVKTAPNIIANYARKIVTGVNSVLAEASLAPDLKLVIADLRSKHGPDSVKVEGGRSDRRVRGGRRMSCHAGGHAFDGRLSPAARADVRSRPQLGHITYSGAMSHDHVSLCGYERGVRTHLVVNARGVPVKYAKRTQYASARKRVAHR